LSFGHNLPHQGIGIQVTRMGGNYFPVRVPNNLKPIFKETNLAIIVSRFDTRIRVS
jgi:hypothetical protein